MASTNCKPLPQLSDRDIHKFWSYVDKRGPDECWPYVGGVSSTGYGAFCVKRVTRLTIGAHRIALFLHTGMDCAPLFTCHSCDERYPIGDISYRRCCNGAHLFPGTHEDNMADMVAKGRGVAGRPIARYRSYSGEGNPFVRLTEADVLSIRAAYAVGGISQRELAEKFKTTHANIGYIVRRLHWTHI